CGSGTGGTRGTGGSGTHATRGPTSEVPRTGSPGTRGPRASGGRGGGSPFGQAPGHRLGLASPGVGEVQARGPTRQHLSRRRRDAVPHEEEQRGRGWLGSAA